MTAGVSVIEQVPAAGGAAQPEARSAPTRPAAPATPPVCWAFPLLTGALLWMCYHPLALGHWGAWFALVPLLTLVRSRMPSWQVYLTAWGTGYLFFGAALHWMSVADPFMIAAWLMLALYCSLYFVVAVAMLRRLDARWKLPLTLTVPVVWVSLEFVRSFLGTGFAWYFLGHSQHRWLAVIQVTDLAGVYAVSFLVAACNGFLFDLAYQFARVRGWFCQRDWNPVDQYCAVEMFNQGALADTPFRRNLILEGMALAALFVAALIYGNYRLQQTTVTAGPTVALLQGSLDQRLRNQATINANNARAQIFDHYLPLMTQAMARPSPDLIIWPEASYPEEWVEVDPRTSPDDIPDAWTHAEVNARAQFRGLARYYKTAHLLGVSSHVLAPGGKHRKYNSAMLLNPKGSVEARFDKMHRVPFGEYIPLKEWLPFLKNFTPYDFEYGIDAGEKFQRFELGSHKFGVLVCFEDSDPFLARRYVTTDDDGSPVDFLVNMSNDGWFDGSAEHEEHLAIARFRAIECRRALVRAVNMGISAVIDSNGRVLNMEELVPGFLDQTPVDPRGEKLPPAYVTDEPHTRPASLPALQWASFKQRPLVVKATVPIDNRSTLYARAGDWLPIGGWLGLLPALALRRRRPSARA